MLLKKLLCLFLLTPLSFSLLSAQVDRWQQAAKYEMEIDFDVEKHQYDGKQTLSYTNNSPDTLHRVFYHLYFNAFQPGSMMDVRSQTIKDPDGRVGKRIGALKPEEIGYIRVASLTQDGKRTSFEEVGTILEVDVAAPILPGQTTVFKMEYEAQVPIQIRRSGRDNAEGISYSMSQWYPKMAEYDYQGWHSNPYIAREFHGIWGDFDVKIKIQKDYIVGATGYLQNPQEIGHGYTEKDVRRKGRTITYHYKAPKVHDFVWAADPDYTHTTRTREDGTVLHFFYQKNEKTEETWANLPKVMDKAFDFINENYGQYPYKQYSFIQGGDGGMEYPMATLITGERSFGSLVGVSIHELMHSWYQMILGSNEALYAWMDEGFTSYASREVTNFLRKEGMIQGKPSPNVHLGANRSYITFSQSGLEEPLITHADHFNTNTAYSTASYTKGSVFLNQMEYVIGKDVFRKGLLRYFHDWKFKHPNSNDVIRSFEKVSGLELDWYREYFVNTTHTIDYRIKSVSAQEHDQKVMVTMERIGLMPMPLDVVVTKTDGTKIMYNIPLRIMRGEKSLDEFEVNQSKLAEDWPWVQPEYRLLVDVPQSEIKSIVIDPSQRMADIDPTNNTWDNNQD